MNISDEASRLIYESSRIGEEWQMSHADRCALLQILRAARPMSALEIGTAAGGSLEHICRYARQTYSIDILPEVRESLEREMPNVEFLTGDSRKLIGLVINQCIERRQPLGFVLIDGDHTYAGVKGDVEAVLAIRP